MAVDLRLEADGVDTKYRRYAGVFYVTNSKEKWEASGLAGTSPPLPFTVFQGANGQFRSYSDVQEMNKGTNPFSTGLVKVENFVYHYFTGKTGRSKPGDKPVGVAVVSDKLSNLDKYSEILYLAFNRAKLKEWPGDISEMTLFYGLRSYPDIKLKVSEVEETSYYEWQLWATVTEGGTSYSCCIFRLMVKTAPSGQDVESVTFEHRVYDVMSSDAFRSTLLTSYRFVVSDHTLIDQFPLAALVEDTHADIVYINDQRLINGQRGLSYVLQANETLPIGEGSLLLKRAQDEQLAATRRGAVDGTQHLRLEASTRRAACRDL